MVRTGIVVERGVEAVVLPDMTMRASLLSRSGRGSTGSSSFLAGLKGMGGGGGGEGVVEWEGEMCMSNGGGGRREGGKGW